jgi:hypothetical protein
MTQTSVAIGNVNHDEMRWANRHALPEMESPRNCKGEGEEDGCAFVGSVEVYTTRDWIGVG